MTIEERLERLTERHEALTQTVELLARDLHETKEVVARIVKGVERLVTVMEHYERRNEKPEAE
ncbi:MAG: hypothetical protein JOZ83_01230 [Silvibacterium sp.]|nr:hypothetical protein [Silvibacterium sp.]